ncbi:MAG: diguanylate cyclase [Gammaproteobacteria bacterium]
MPSQLATALGAGTASASTASEQLERGFRRLCFSPDLEADYRTGQFRDGARYLRVNLALLAVFILLINQVDQSVLPTTTAISPYLARIGVLPPLLALGLALTYTRHAAVWYARVMTVAMAFAMMAIAWMAVSAWELGDDRIFVRVVIAASALWFVLGLGFRAASLVNFAGLALFTALAVAWNMPAADLVHYLSMLVLTNLVSGAGAWNLEHARRTAWLEARMLAEHALHDGLTGACNRRRFDDHLLRIWQLAMRERKAVALLFADIDHFKKYNDHYGHQAGDEALKAVAGVLMRHARRPLDMAARFGGEEFALLLYNANREHALRVADEVLQEVRGLGIVHADSVASGVLTISIGAACVQPEKGRSAAGLLQLADQALYAAKDGGRDQVRAAGAEYEQMKTGYFHRRMMTEGKPADGQ